MQLGTIWILIACALVLIAWDIYVAIRGPKATISRTLLTFAQKHIVVAFAFGVLMGHLFWSQTCK